jgi:hypothetical protein
MSLGLIDELTDEGDGEQNNVWVSISLIVCVYCCCEANKHHHPRSNPQDK